VKNSELAQSLCTACRAALEGRAAFLFHTGEGSLIKCMLCAVRHRPMLGRSIRVSLVVGTILIGINHGDVLLRGEWREGFTWKLALTYAVPFLVATWGALGNSRLRR
jgi:hypothetical protein